MMKRILLCLLVACSTLCAAPKAVVFDFGGVMTTAPNREAVMHFLCTSFSLSREEFEIINQEKKKAVKDGKRDQDFWLGYAKQKNIILPKDWEQQFTLVMKSAIGVNPDMYALVTDLKTKGIPVALLSNIDERLASMLRAFGLYEPFDPCLLSCEIGFSKPDPKIYEFLLKELHLPAKDIVFIDDKSENIEAAQKLGLDAILFSSQEQLQKDLKQRGVFE